MRPLTSPGRPPLRAGLVPRPRLTRPLLGSAEAPLALVVAPAGYGKTTVLSQWAEQDKRPFAWVTLDQSHNDPRRLLAAIASALDPIEPCRHGDGSARTDFLRAFAGRERPFVLVLDDVHELHAARSTTLVSSIVRHMPSRSQVALASREVPRMPVGRLRANRQVVELRFRDLAMTPSEAAALLKDAGLDLNGGEVETILHRTEGWAAGLYLAALSLRESADPATAVHWFGGHDRLVADYVRDEMLSGLSQEKISFLRRTAVLDEVSGPLCDAVLERAGTAGLLAELARLNLMVFPTRDDGCYRYHGLLAQMLRSELRRSEPEQETHVHRRAAGWYAGKDDVDRAVAHAIAARDAGFAGELLWANLARYLAYGRNDSVTGWLERFTDAEIAAHPALSLVAAFSHLALGDCNLVAHWTSAAARRLDEVPEAPSLEAGVSVLRAAVARNGITRMLEDAEHAYALFADDHPWRSMCCLLVGVAHHLSGARRPAREWLEEGARRGAVGAPSIQALCLVQLALLAIEEDDWAGANFHAMRARAQVEHSGLSGDPASALVFAVSAAANAHSGRIDEARMDTRRAEKLTAKLADFAPWYEVEVRVSLARAALRLSDVSGAGRHVADAARILQRSPDAVVLWMWLEDSSIRGESARGNSGTGEWSLTTAELRVLQFLPTHLSLPEIAKMLNVSANTVKTHTRAVYRKLDARSRAQAVAQARGAGLIDANRGVLAEAA
jgi:LuxR family maltose regulon positive regulatory protein